MTGKMKLDDFYHLMEDTSRLSEKTLPELKAIVDDFPYFPVARALYLKNLSELEDIRFGQELKRMAVCLPDRKKLFMLIEGKRYGLQIVKSIRKEEEDSDSSFLLIDSFLSSCTNEKETSRENTFLFPPSVSSDYIFWAISNEEIPVEEQTTPPLQHQDLIDSFIQSEEERPAGSRILPEESLAEDSAFPESILAGDSEIPVEALDDSYFTETLARIYVKQKRYEKALQIIRNLSLKYPEKSIYFADQIRFLEKLIINTKKIK